MAQIGFTKKTEHIYDRFADLLLKEKQRSGRVYAPQFLDAMMDLWEEYTRRETESNESQLAIIRQSDGALYIERALAHNHNFEMTHHRNEAMIFDSSDQAKVFLRKCGRDAGEWIIEPV
jgi:hypothetical protein